MKPLLLLMSVLIFLPLAYSSSQDYYQVSYFQKNPGLHFENIGKIKLYNQKWQLVTYLNLNNVYSSYSNLSNYYNRTIQICNDLKLQNITGGYYKSYQKDFVFKQDSATLFFHINEVCTNNLKIIKNYMDQIPLELKHVSELLGHNDKRNITRFKRNIFGKAMKHIFGTLNSDDAKYFSSKIDEIRDENVRQNHMIKQLTNVVQTTINNFNESITVINMNQRLFENSLRSFGEVQDRLKKNQGLTGMRQTIDEHFAHMILVLGQLQLDIQGLVNAILFAQVGQLHPKILSPFQLIDEFKAIEHFIPPGTEFPLDLSYENAHLLLKTITLNVFFIDGKLIYTIEVPLVQPEMYDLYHMTPLPVNVSLNTYIFISIEKRYLAITAMHSKFITLSQNDISTYCISVNEMTSVCKLAQPIFTGSANTQCIVEIFKSTLHVPPTCETRVMQLSDNLWTQYQKQNKWIFVLSKPEQITISCKNSEIIPITLDSSGTLELESFCNAYTSSTILMSHSLSISNVSKEYISTVDITSMCCDYDVLQRINNEYVNIFGDHKLMDLNSDKLNEASLKLERIKGMVDSMSLFENHRRLSIGSISLALVLSFLLAVCICVYAVMKYIKSRRKNEIVRFVQNLNYS